MSLDIVAAVRAKYPTPLGGQHGFFLLDVAGHLGLGLLRKEGGTVVTLPDGTNVSQDTVINRSGDAWDILVDGENTAKPVWNSSQHIDDASRYYAVSGAQSQPPAPPAPPQSPALLESFMNDVRSSLGRVEAALDELSKKPAPVVNAPPVTFPRYQGSTDITLPLIGKQHVTMTLEPKP